MSEPAPVAKPDAGWKTKDVVTASIAAVALLVSFGSAFFTGLQYGLNNDRDKREQKFYRDDRKPIIRITSIPQGPDRRFKLTFEFKNRQFDEVQLMKIELIDPLGYRLQDMPGEPGQSAARVQSTVWNVPPHLPTATFAPNTLAVGERVRWDVLLNVPQEAALPPQTTVTFKVYFRLLDNDDTLIDIPRTVQIN